MRDRDTMIFLEMKEGQEQLEIAFVGDTGFGESYQQRIKKNGGLNILEEKGYDYPLEKVKDLLITSDLVIANLETPLTTLTESPLKSIKKYCHWSDPVQALNSLIKHNVHVVNLANNHTLDYGEEGLIQTLNVLKEKGISFFGAGHDENEAETPIIIQLKIKQKDYYIAVIGGFEERENYKNQYKFYAEKNKSGVQMLDVNKIQKSIEKIKLQYPSAFIIVSPHWGRDYEWKTTKQAGMARKLIEIGVNLIVGHGAHRLQEIEHMHGCWVLFGIGNFMFNSPGRYALKNAPCYSLVSKLMCSVHKDNLEINIRLYPLVSDNQKTNYQPRYVTDQEFKEVCTLLIEKSDAIKLMKQDKDLSGWFLEFSAKEPPNKMLNKQHNRNRSESNRPVVGLLCRVMPNQNLSDKYIPWVSRAWVMDKAFKREGIDLFMYAHGDVQSDTKEVRGYCMENNQFVSRTREVPGLNYDWNIARSDQPNVGMNYTAFHTWAKKNDVVLYPDLDLTIIARDKYKTYELIKKHKESIQPLSEILQEPTSQIEHFFRKNNLILLKPRFGNHGEGIIFVEQGTNKRGGLYYFLEHYKGVEKHEIYFTNFGKFVAHVTKTIGKNAYIIQNGVRNLRKAGSVFNIRVMMVHDGLSWQWVHEVRCASHYSAVSTFPFLGVSRDLLLFMSNFLDKVTLELFIFKLHKMAFDLTEYLDDVYAGNVFEVAYDFVVDEKYDIYLVEINTKPGIIGDPNILPNFFERDSYGEQTDLYVKYMAQFFKKKLQELQDKDQKSNPTEQS